MNSFSDTLFEGDSTSSLHQLLDEASSLIVLTDTHTSRFCLPLLKEHIETPFHHVEVPTGEVHKNIDTAQTIWQQMVQWNIDRNGLLINLGGGVITDMGGFVASVYKRGIRYIQAPTTLLGMVDAAIGGKNGIDFLGYKNFLGVIRLPLGVWIEPAFLKTLPEEQIRSGAAEIIKAALIRDTALWEAIEQLEDISGITAPDIIKRAIEIKREVVSSDPEEKGLRKILNFGHTIGHAVESYCLNEGRPVSHGDAVAIGMYYESKLANASGFLSEEAYKSIVRVLHKHYNIPSFSPAEVEYLLQFMMHDKKNSGQTILGILLHHIGRPEWGYTYAPDTIRTIMMEK